MFSRANCQISGMSWNMPCAPDTTLVSTTLPRLSRYATHANLACTSLGRESNGGVGITLSTKIGCGTSAVEVDGINENVVTAVRTAMVDLIIFTT